MSLQTVPIELFLLIASNLSIVDERCLRLTCSGFRSIMPHANFNKLPPSTEELDKAFRHGSHSDSEDDSDNELDGELEKDSADHGDPSDNDSDDGSDDGYEGPWGEFLHSWGFIDHFMLLERLLKDADGVYRGMSLHGACLRCLRVLPESDFETLFTIDDKRICHTCLKSLQVIDIPFGHRYTSRDGGRIYTCSDDCGHHLKEADAHDHKLRGDAFHRSKYMRLCLACHFCECNDPGCRGWPQFVRENWDEIMDEEDHCSPGCVDCIIGVAKAFRASFENLEERRIA